MSDTDKNSKLETLIENHHNKGHHMDPLDMIANHVVVLVFISLLFLASIFVFMTSVPSDSHATAYAIVEYKDVIPDFEIVDKVSSAIDTARSSNDQPYLLLMMFVGWIMVAGLINIALHEKELNKEAEQKNIEQDKKREQ